MAKRESIGSLGFLFWTPGNNFVDFVSCLSNTETPVHRGSQWGSGVSFPQSFTNRYFHIVLVSIPLIEIADVIFEVYDCSPFIHSKQTNKQTNKQTKNKQILSEKIQYSSALVVQTHVHLKSINAILHLVMLLLSRYVNRRATIQLYTERVDVIFSRHTKIMSKQNISLNSYAF